MIKIEQLKEAINKEISFWGKRSAFLNKEKLLVTTREVDIYFKRIDKILNDK